MKGSTEEVSKARDCTDEFSKLFPELKDKEHTLDFRHLGISISDNEKIQKVINELMFNARKDVMAHCVSKQRLKEAFDRILDDLDKTDIDTVKGNIKLEMFLLELE